MKQHVYPMLGFKSFRNAAVTINGIELAQKIKEGAVRHRDIYEWRECSSTGNVGSRTCCLMPNLMEHLHEPLMLFAPEPGILVSRIGNGDSRHDHGVSTT